MKDQARDGDGRWRYAWRSERLALVLAFAAVVVAVFLVRSANQVTPDVDGGLAAWWSHWVDPALAVVTVLLALFLWAAGFNGRWKASLPKRLTVHFVLGSNPNQGRPQDEYVFTCYEAYLSGESDIRALGQSIGQQMHGGQRLDFYPCIEESGPHLRRDGLTRQVYEATFFLRSDPSVRPTYKVWFDNDAAKKGNRELVTARRAAPIAPAEAADELEAQGRPAVPSRPQGPPTRVRLVNRTPHRVNLHADGDVVLRVDRRHEPPRVREIRSAPFEVMTDSGPLPLIEISYADTIENLPEPENGVWLIVSRVTAAAAPDRDDLVFPLDVERDDAGEEVRARALGRYARAGFSTPAANHEGG